MRLRIGLLLDSWTVKTWQAGVINSILANPRCEIVFIAINQSASTNQSKRRKIVYSFMRWVDRKLFPVKEDCFGSVSLKQLLVNTACLQIVPVCKRYTDSFSELDVSAIESMKADLIVRFGFRILKGGILKSARFGVWSLHHGDTSVNRGGPPGFWEVVNREDVTGVTLQVLSDELDGGQVIGKSFIRTNTTSFNRNQNSLFWAGVELFCYYIDRQSLSYPVFVGGESDIAYYSERLYRDPPNYSALKIFLLFWFRRIVLFRSRNRKHWRIYIGRGSSKALFKFSPLIQPSTVDWADPFIVKHHDEYFLFFENLKIGSGKGNISVLKLDGAGRLASQEPITVLEEDFHLSYPFVFKFNSEYFMTPECGSDHRVWLYRAENFPNGWRKQRMLIDKELYDPTLFEHEGNWYLFATERPFSGCLTDQFLVIYYTDDLLNGTWTRHPQSPLTRDVRVARPAGMIIRKGGRLIRPAQIGAPHYGSGIVFMEIKILTPNQYVEEFRNRILPNWDDGIRAVHTFNEAGDITVVDAQVNT